MSLFDFYSRVLAHKIILSCNSPYFAAMFNSPLKESIATEVFIQDVDGETLELLVNYCYTGTLAVNEENVEKILSTACLFQMPHVVQACSNFLGKQLHFTNAIGFTLFAEQQNCDDLYQLSLSFTARNFMEIYQNSEEFLRMNVEQLSTLLKNNDLNVTSEEDVFKALVKWLNHSDERMNNIQTLLPLVKLSQLSPMFIADHVESFCTTLETQKILLDAFKWQLIPERRNLADDSSVPRKSTVGKLLTIGGMDQHKGSINIESYDPREDKWDVLKNMPNRRLQFGCALYMDKLLIVGGRDGLKTLNNVDAIDLQTMSWTSLSSPLATPRHGLGIALLKGALYAVGGHDGWSYLNSVERLDLTTKQWSYIAPMQTMRSTAGVAILDDKLYVVGGRESSICHRTVEMYCPHTNRWMQKSPMNKRRGGVSVASYNGCLYVFGGHDLPVSNPACQRTSSIEKYDPVTDTWTFIANLDMGRDSIGVAVLGNSIITIGGFDGTNYLKTVEKFDPETSQFEKLKPITFPRAGACVVAVGNNQLSGCGNESFFSTPAMTHSSTV